MTNLLLLLALLYPSQHRTVPYSVTLNDQWACLYSDSQAKDLQHLPGIIAYNDDCYFAEQEN